MVQQPLSVEPADDGSATAPPTILHTRVVVGAGGGVDKTIVNSPRFLRQQGYNTLCAFMRAPGDDEFQVLAERAADAQAPLLTVDDRGLRDWRILREMLRLCRRHRVAIWHAHDYKSNLIGLMLRPFHPMRLVTTVHGWVTRSGRMPLYYGVDRVCLPWYERVICVSDDIYEACRRQGVSSKRLVLVRNAIDCQQYQRRRSLADAKRALGIPPERLVIGAVGRLSSEKAFDTLIEAVDLLLRSGRDVELLIVGEGEERGRLRERIDRLGRGERIRLLGFQADVPRIYEAMDVFALSSLREGLPNVILEAMALEVPIVATRIAGVPSIVRDGENGLLVEPGDRRSLHVGLERAVDDEPLRRALREAGRETVEGEYSFARRMRKIGGLYSELIARRSQQSDRNIIPWRESP